MIAFTRHKFSDKELTFPCTHDVNEAMRPSYTWPLRTDFILGFCLVLFPLNFASIYRLENNQQLNALFIRKMQSLGFCSRLPGPVSDHVFINRVSIASSN